MNLQTAAWRLERHGLHGCEDQSKEKRKWLICMPGIGILSQQRGIGIDATQFLKFLESPKDYSSSQRKCVLVSSMALWCYFPLLQKSNEEGKAETSNRNYGRCGSWQMWIMSGRDRISGVLIIIASVVTKTRNSPLYTMYLLQYGKSS